MLTIEWPTLHECVLQKRRNENKKKKNNPSNTVAGEIAVQTSEQEQYDE